MNRHPFRWECLAFGAFFLACAGNWAVWEQDLLTPRELSLTAAGALIVLGVFGVAATLLTSRRTNAPNTPPSTEGATHEQATDPQP